MSELRERLRLLARYTFLYPPDRSDTLAWIATGCFDDPTPTFSILSGDTSWIDTVKSFTEVEHSIVVRALQRGDFIISAQVGAPLNDGYRPGDHDAITLTVE